ncbi:6922_t:CDS:2 [Entrophospora sp. SA101]|nr:6922_t:CDS:2 [Entrophospora sp. SA101]
MSDDLAESREDNMVNEGPGTANAVTNDVSVKTFRREDVMKHYNIHKNVEKINNEQENPWYLIIYNKVYDVKDFIPGHPGGAVILTHLGKDALVKIM